ncbi:MAG: hypothetical protein ILP12_05030 [Lachnospiraceae bacterium]|nr:hypothetical protein [Lachnospiraceae bacterium]
MIKKDRKSNCGLNFGFLLLSLLITVSLLGTFVHGESRDTERNAENPPDDLQLMRSSPGDYDPYYSENDPLLFNTETIPSYGTQTDLTQYRMNCYGYAFRFILQGSATINSNGGYKQNPGDFAAAGRLSDVIPMDPSVSPAIFMEYLENNILLDALRLGYTVTRFYPSQATSEVTFNCEGRLVAAVTGNYGSPGSDYHFYMRHPDGTWSHKRGSWKVYNTSITSGILLTDQNIRLLANEDIYANGELRFYIITRDAVYDHPHAARAAGYQIPVYDSDIGGDHPQSAYAVLPDGEYYGGYWDYAEDNDYYRFTTEHSYVTFEAWSTEGEFRLELYDSSGLLVDYEDGPNLVLSHSFTGLTIGATYYFRLVNTDSIESEYIWTAQ